VTSSGPTTEGFCRTRCTRATPRRENLELAAVLVNPDLNQLGWRSAVPAPAGSAHLGLSDRNLTTAVVSSAPISASASSAGAEPVARRLLGRLAVAAFGAPGKIHLRKLAGNILGKCWLSSLRYIIADCACRLAGPIRPTPEFCSSAALRDSLSCLPVRGWCSRSVEIALTSDGAHAPGRDDSRRRRRHADGGARSHPV